MWGATGCRDMGCWVHGLCSNLRGQLGIATYRTTPMCPTLHMARYPRMDVRGWTCIIDIRLL